MLAALVEELLAGVEALFEFADLYAEGRNGSLVDAVLRLCDMLGEVGFGDDWFFGGRFGFWLRVEEEEGSGGEGQDPKEFCERRTHVWGGLSGLEPVLEVGAFVAGREFDGKLYATVDGEALDRAGVEFPFFESF